jgi:hypothetical protein
MMKSACRRDDHRDSVPDRQHVARTSEQEAPMLRTPILALAAAGILAAASARATEYTLFANLCLPDLGGRSADACPARALLNLPQAWPRGGTAVVLLTQAPVPDAPRDPLVAALLSENIAVLELVPAALATPSDGGAAAAPDPVAGLFRALIALRRHEGAGTVIAIGFGEGASIALEAVSEEQAEQHLGNGGDRYAAAMAFRDGPAAFVRGTAAVREWRLAVLCEAIGLAAGTPATEIEPLAWADGCYTTLLGRPRPGSPMVAKLRR